VLVLPGGSSSPGRRNPAAIVIIAIVVGLDSLVFDTRHLARLLAELVAGSEPSAPPPRRVRSRSLSKTPSHPRRLLRQRRI